MKFLNSNRKGYALLYDHKKTECGTYRIPLASQAIEARKRLMRIEIQNAPVRWEFRRDRRIND